jgi:hypothetical protein
MGTNVADDSNDGSFDRFSDFQDWRQAFCPNNTVILTIYLLTLVEID